VKREVAAELKKLRTIWSTWLILGITAVLVGVITSVIAFAPHNNRGGDLLFPVRGTTRWFDSVFSALTSCLTLALVLGILSMTGEYRHKTITPTYLAEPRRGRVVASKLLAAALGGVAVAVVAGAVALVFGFSVVGAGIGDVGRMLTEYRHVFPGVLAAAVLYAVYGVGLGALLKNQVVAVVVGLGVTTIIEPILVGVVPAVGKWAPGQVAQALESVTANANGFNNGIIHLVPWWQGGLALLGYGVVLAAAGSFTTLRSDVT
jgi:ABC-type transport system involved in multi-copper enzyme maturation permease subunit